MYLTLWSHGDPVPEYARYRQWRAHADLYRRALVGPGFYIVTCVFLWLTGDYSRLAAQALAGSAVLFGLLWYLRWRNLLPHKSVSAADHTRWHQRQWALIYAGYGLWAALVAVIGIDQHAQNTATIITLLATAVYGAAACIAFTDSQKLQAILLLILAAPFVFVWGPLVPELRALVYAYSVTWLWACMSGRNFCAEYESQMQLEYQLLVSQADNDRLARTDALTGLPNRREYESVYATAWNQRSRSKEPLSLLAIDIDHFKHINDRYGHLAGDAGLQHVAQLMQSHFRRANDFIARVGGEEFVVLLPGTPVDEAFVLAEDFRALLERTPCIQDRLVFPIAVSIGVGEALPAEDSTPDATYARIDSACYAAKAAGRNRVERAAVPQPPSSRF